MANSTGHGGARTPAKPAAVSGMGAKSARTDGGPGNAKQPLRTLPGQDYGQGEQMLNQQRIQPLPAENLPAAAQVAAGGGQDQGAQMAPYGGGGFADPSTRPGEPITTGAAIGPGGGPEAIRVPMGTNQPGQGTGAMTQLLQSLSATDTTGVLGQLMQAAQARNA